MIPVYAAQDGAQTEDFFARLAERASPADGAVEKAVADILADVRDNGLDAVLRYTRKYDAPDFSAGQFAVSEEELCEAARSVDPAELAVIKEAAANIRSFHEAQKRESWFTTRSCGTILGQMLVPVDRAGLYVPGGQGGKTPLISSLLMNAIPAQVAGVPEISVISPPQKNGKVNAHILATAQLLGIRQVYAAGSAWAVAALAYGAGPLLPVDVIAGPGNIYVATAKRLLIGRVGIDMIAGPSEVCIIADASANPAWIAADMLSQAEHDRQASAVCLCSSDALARQIAAELEKQLADLPRADIARDSLAAYSAIITAPNLQAAVNLANRIAPEHLELLLEDPWTVLPAIRHAGAVFMGHYSAEPLGDYYAGPNHVLPTMSTARFASALSVDTFCKKTSVIAASPAFAAKAARPTALLARLEGLEAHARSALCREQS